MSRAGGKTSGEIRRIAVAANSSWNIVNFRGGLIRALKQAGYQPVVIAPAEEASAERIDQLGVEHIILDLNRSGINPVADARLFLAYRTILRKLRPVAFLGFTIKPNIYGSLAARTLGIPAIANISGLGTVFLRRGALLKVVTPLYRLALRRAEVVFFQNPDDFALFRTLKIVSEKQARLLPGSGIDLELFRPRPLPPGPPTFLLVARLLGDKGVREFAAAARIVRLQHPDVRFQLLGPIDEGNRTAVTRTELEQWVADGVVEYVGAAQDVRPFIEQATAIVLPSYREGLPRSLLEAAAMARPLIATDVPGCREVVKHGVNGFLCAARSAGDLALAIGRLCEMTAAEHRAMGAASRALVEKRFSERLVIDSYLDCLQPRQPRAN